MKEIKKIIKDNKVNVSEYKDLLGGYLISLGYKTKDFKTFKKELGKCKSIVKFGFKNKELICYMDYLYDTNRDYNFLEFEVQVFPFFIKEMIEHTNNVMEYYNEYY